MDLVSYAVSSVDLAFSSPINFSSVSSGDFSLDTPNGGLPQANLSPSLLNANALRILFPPQDTIGYYEIEAGPAIEDIYGLSMSTAYIGSFAFGVRSTAALGTSFTDLPVSAPVNLGGNHFSITFTPPGGNQQFFLLTVGLHP